MSVKWLLLNDILRPGINYEIRAPPVLFTLSEYVVSLSAQWDAKILPDKYFVSDEAITGYFRCQNWILYISSDKLVKSA
jgi:hypothetical protein